MAYENRVGGSSWSVGGGGGGESPAPPMATLKHAVSRGSAKLKVESFHIDAEGDDSGE